jgi:YidC/Oxa1 family membrane protein insertase
METESRRLILALAVMLVVIFGYQYVFNTFFPPPKPAPVAAPPASQPVGQPAATPAAPATGVAPPATTAAAGAPIYAFVSAEDLAEVPFGGQEGDALRMKLTPRGAALKDLELYAKDNKGRLLNRETPAGNEPHHLLRPVPDGGRDRYSFATYRIWIQEQANQSWSLDLEQVIWKVVEKAPHKVVFSTTLRAEQSAEDRLHLTKTYELHDGKPVFDLQLTIENVAAAPLTVWVEQDGPIGMCREDQQYDVPSLLVTQGRDGAVEVNKAHQRGELLKATKANEPVKLTVPDKGPVCWIVLANKYFGVFTRPLPLTLPLSANQQDYIATASGVVAAQQSEDDLGDLIARLETKPTQLAPGAQVRYPFEVYAGAKDADHVREADPAYAGKDKLYYEVSQVTSQRCCTFLWIQNLMIWLLEWIHAGVRNYGIAIMVLVIIVRSILHPLAVYQQKSMFRMQESMARIQPKMQALKERYANDKVRLNQETMKVWSEEGVNPLGQVTAFLPILIQMPILIALWNGLSIDVNLRHAPFDGWWILDLSSPDAFYTFIKPFNVPVLSEIPLIGGVFKGVPSINLLPVFMGLSMWLQQKYMPRPAMQAKLEAAKQQAAAGKPKSGPSPEDQLRQQQMMAYMMAVVFPLMFYKMPAGLNLYWMATNVFGIFESLIIRKQIEEAKKRRAAIGPLPPKKGGLLGRFFKHIAAQAEELQKKADQVGRLEGPKSPAPESREPPAPESRKPTAPDAGKSPAPDVRKRKRR